MKSYEFYNEFNKKIENMSLNQLKQLIKNLVRKIPESKYNEVLDIFNSNSDMNEQSIKNKISEYQKIFSQINNFELYFSATGYEDYDDYYDSWGGDWTWEYTDEDNIGALIYEATLFAVELTNKRFYKYAKKLFDTIIYTNYQVLDEDAGDSFEISLDELKDNYLININVKSLCLYAIYTTYQNSSEENRCINIYEYFKNINFKNISIEDSFKLGSEVLNGTDKFWNNWINLLLTKPGDVEYRLLKEAFIYNDFANYNQYVSKIAKCHPKIYIDLFNYLNGKKQINDILNIGNKVLPLLDDNLKIKSDIALYLAKLDDKNKEQYLISSFESNSNIPNLLRIINNGYFPKYEHDIENIMYKIKNNINDIKKDLEKNIVNKEDYLYLCFFSGKFEDFFKECLNIKNTLGWTGSFIQRAVYLWLIYFNKNIESKVYKNILSSVFTDLDFEDNLLFLDDDYSKIFSKWKEIFNITNAEVYIDWLENIIDRRVDEIVSNGYRKSYFKAAILVVGLGEILESNNIQNKLDFVNCYHKKYSRRSSFRKELNNYI